MKIAGIVSIINGDVNTSIFVFCKSMGHGRYPCIVLNGPVGVLAISTMKTAFVFLLRKNRQSLYQRSRHEYGRFPLPRNGRFLCGDSWTVLSGQVNFLPPFTVSVLKNEKLQKGFKG